MLYNLLVNRYLLGLLFALLLFFSGKPNAKTDETGTEQSSNLRTSSQINNQSINLTKAKDLHYVGETFSGFIAPLRDKIPDRDSSKIESLVDSINQLRQEKYNAIAKNNSLDANMIARIAGEKLVMKETKNRYIKGLNGQWMLTK